MCQCISMLHIGNFQKYSKKIISVLLFFHESNLKPQQRKQFLLNWHPKYLVCILPLSHCLFGISIKANTTAEQTNSSQAFSHCALNFTICLKCFKVVVFDFHTFKQSYTWRPDLPENCNLITWFFFCICSVITTLQCLLLSLCKWDPKSLCIAVSMKN